MKLNNYIFFLLAKIIIQFTFLPLYSHAQPGFEGRMWNTIASGYGKYNISKPYGIKTYYSEIAKVNDKYVAFTDAVGILLSFGHDYLIPLNSLNFINTNMRKSDRHPVWLSYLEKNFFDPDNPEAPPPSCYQPEVTVLLNAFRRFELNGPLNRRKTRHYNVELTKTGDDYVELRFGHKPEKPDIYHYLGVFFINTELNQIDSAHINKARWYSYQHREVIDGWLKIYYAWDKNSCWLERIEGGYVMNEKELTVTMQTLSSNPKLNPLSERGFSAFMIFSANPIITYDSQFWKENEFIPASKMKTIERDLGDAKSLQQQFSSNNNKPYFTGKMPNGEIYPDTNDHNYRHVKERLPELIKMVE